MVASGIAIAAASMPTSQSPTLRSGKISFRKTLTGTSARRGDLKALGWDAIVIWECETTDDDRLVCILNGRVS